MRLSAPSISLTTVVALFYLSATSLSTEALPAAPLNQHSSLVSYAKHKVVRVSIPSKKVLGTLIKNEAFFQPDYFTHDMNIGGYVDMRIAPENFAKFKALKLKYKVLTNNLQPYLDQEHERDQRYQQQWEELKKSKVSRDGVMMNALSSSADWFSGYHTLQDSVNWLNAQAQSRASIASVFTAGKSVEGRDLTGIKIGSGPKTIVIIGLQHAREWIATSVVQYIIDQLLSGTDTRAASYLKKYTFHIIPIVNPDGYEYTWTTDRLWRKNRSPPPPKSTCYGVDLNRNWDYQWGKVGSTGNVCDDTYKGPRAFSEPETANVAKYLQSLQNMALFIDFHSYGQDWMYPYNYAKGVVPPNSAYLDSLAQKAVQAVKQVNGVQYAAGPGATTIYPASGVAMDFVQGNNIANAAFNIELRDQGQYGFNLPAEFILPSGKETWAGVSTMLDNLV